MRGCFFLRWRADKRNQNAAAFQHFPRSLLRVAALCVQNDIDVMRATPQRNRDFAPTTRQVRFIRELVETSVGAYLHIDGPGFSLTLEGDH